MSEWRRRIMNASDNEDVLYLGVDISKTVKMEFGKRIGDFKLVCKGITSSKTTTNAISLGSYTSGMSNNIDPGISFDFKYYSSLKTDLNVYCYTGKGSADYVFKRKYIKHPFDFEAVYHETGLIGSLMYGTMSLKATDSTGAVYEYENNRFGHYMIDMDAIYISAHSDLKIDYVKLIKL